MLKTFGNQDKLNCDQVTDLKDCDVADTFPSFAEQLSANGFAFLYQRIKAGHSDGPILVTVDDRRIVGAIGPLGILLHRNANATATVLRRASRLPASRPRQSTVAGGNDVGCQERRRIQSPPSSIRECG